MFKSKNSVLRALTRQKFFIKQNSWETCLNQMWTDTKNYHFRPIKGHQNNLLAPKIALTRLFSPICMDRCQKLLMFYSHYYTINCVGSLILQTATDSSYSSAVYKQTYIHMYINSYLFFILLWMVMAVENSIAVWKIFGILKNISKSHLVLFLYKHCFVETAKSSRWKMLCTLRMSSSEKSE